MEGLYAASLKAGPLLVHASTGASIHKTSDNSNNADSSTNHVTRDSALRLFDVDANLTHEQLRKDIVDLLTTASTKAHLKACIVPGSDVEDSKLALDFAVDEDLRKKSGVEVYSTFGVHPYNAKGTIIPERFFDDARRLLSENGRVVAVGETGLDISEGFPPLEEQLVWFRHQLDLACELQKPLFLHERNAHEPFMQELMSRKERLPKKLLVHCFTGNEPELRSYLDFGCYISISGLICRADKEGKRFKEVIKAVAPPSDRLMLETDAPYMQFPGCRRLASDGAWKTFPNIPASIIQVAESVSKLLGRDLGSVGEDSFRTAEDFFGVQIKKEA